MATHRGCPGGARAVRGSDTSALASSPSPSGGGTPSPPPSVFRPIGGSTTTTTTTTSTSTTSSNEQWARTAAASAARGKRTTTTSATSSSPRTTTPTDGVWYSERQLELRSGLSPMSRPPSANSSASSSPSSPGPTLARVHGHDHNRPLPPPRLVEQSSTGPLTAPLTPLAGQAGILRTSSRAPAPIPVVHDVARIQTSPNDTEQSPLGRGSQLGEVTLTVPRPDGERAVNEYVETPFRPGCHLPAPQKCLKSSNDRAKHHRQHLTQHRGRANPQTPRLLQSGNSPAGVKGGLAPVTKQPVSFTKEPTNSIGGSPGSPGRQIQSQQQQQQQQQLQLQQQQQQQIQQLQQRSSLFPGIGTPGGVGSLDEGLSIMCEYCGKCRCESCREPAPLPSRWLCDNSCFCSAETALDYASCLCCVKGLFYHCGDGGSGVEAEAEGAGSCADEPCSCAGSRRLARWTCLGALTLALPCLLCYWPLRGCVALCEACYARYASHGCRCDPTANAGRHLTASNLRDSRDPEKRLLDPVTPEL